MLNVTRFGRDCNAHTLHTYKIRVVLRVDLYIPPDIHTLTKKQLKVTYQCKLHSLTFQILIFYIKRTSIVSV